MQYDIEYDIVDGVWFFWVSDNKSRLNEDNMKQPFQPYPLTAICLWRTDSSFM